MYFLKTYVVFYAAYLYICVFMTCIYDTRIHGIYVNVTMLYVRHTT